MPKNEQDNKPILYVTRDIERALGLEPNPQYIVVTNKTPFAEKVQALYPKYVHLLGDGHEILHTYSLLTQLQPENILAGIGLDKNNFSIVIFHNSNRIEEFVRSKGWTLMNPIVALAEEVENKITQVEWLGTLGQEFLPPHKVTLVKYLNWENKKFVLQWPHGHTGEGTEVIDSESKLSFIKNKFPERHARISDYIIGPSFTVNIVCAGNNILVSNISYQITGLEPFTDNIFSTIGNDWGVVDSLLSPEEIQHIEDMAQTIGKKMSESGWRGLFGIDVMKDTEKNKIYLIEINARQPASTTYESILQREFKKNGAPGDLSVFEAHIQALKGNSLQEKLVKIKDGAQIIQRVTQNKKYISDDTIGALNLSGHETILYPNTEHNTDMLRIHCTKSIMSGNNKFNEHGQEIIDILNDSNK